MHNRAVFRGPARNLKVRIAEDLAQQLDGYSRARDISISDAVRVLLRDSLTPAPLPEELKVLPALAFATLLAAEQTNTVLQQIYSSWIRDHGHDIPNQTAEAARKRLQDVELALEQPRARYRPWNEERSLLGRVTVKV